MAIGKYVYVSVVTITLGFFKAGMVAHPVTQVIGEQAIVDILKGSVVVDTEE